MKCHLMGGSGWMLIMKDMKCPFDHGHGIQTHLFYKTCDSPDMILVPTKTAYQ